MTDSERVKILAAALQHFAHPGRWKYNEDRDRPSQVSHVDTFDLEERAREALERAGLEVEA